MKAVIYSRISSHEQSEHSLAAQVEECRAWIEKERYELTNVYMDDGYSAKNMNRPQLQQMLSDLKQRKFNIIVIWRLDRLTRDTMDGLNMVKNEFKPNGVEFASINEDIDTSTPDGYMMFTIRLSMAQNEREKIGERVKLGLKARAQKGLRPNASVPYGYNLTPDLKLVVNEEEAETVRQIYDLYLAGNGKFKISKLLTVPTKTGNMVWGERVVNNILNSPTYYGANHMTLKGERTTIIVRGTHEGIISEDTFNEVQKIQKRKQEGLMSTSSSDFPFSNIVKCVECGSSYFGHQYTREGITYRSYRCRNNVKQRSCLASSISEPKMYDLFKRFLDNFDFVTTIDPNKSIDGKDVAKDIKKLTKLIDDATTKKKNYTRAMGSGKLDYDMFAELMEEENAKLETWKSELETLNTMIPNTTRTKRDVARDINEIINNWDYKSHRDRKTIVQHLFEAIVIKKEGNYWHIVGYKLSE